MKRDTAGNKLLYLNVDRLNRIKEFAKKQSIEKERSITANDIILDAIDEYLNNKGIL